MKQYLLGIDGGGSRSKAVLTDLQGNQIISASGRNLNPLNIGWKAFSGHFTDLVKRTLAEVDKKQIAGVCAGLAGSGAESVRKKAEIEIRRHFLTAKVFVISDALATLWGAFRGRSGLILIAGTGSICLGMNAEGCIERSGGFGPLAGDEGSGFWIGMEAIRAALRTVDKRASANSLMRIVSEQFNLQDIRELIPELSAKKIKPVRIAVITPKVIQLSAEDAYAKKIIKEAGEHLARLVKATAEKLELKGGLLALCGGLWSSEGQEMKRSLKHALRKFNLSVQIVPAEEPPECGAIRYLKRQ